MPKINILWFSDIHLQSYHDDSKEKRTSVEDKDSDYLSALVDFIKVEIYHQTTPDYFIITGDLVQGGDNTSYNKFREEIITVLLDHFETIDSQKSTQVITIPGNHDIDWNMVDDIFIKEYISAIDNWNFISFFEKNINKTKFIQLFKNYSNSFLNFNNISNKYFKNFNNPLLKISETFKENRLYGTIIDNQNKIIFALLNSSWLSLGESFGKKLLEVVWKDKLSYGIDVKNLSFAKAELQDGIVKYLTKISEYGSQSLRLDATFNYLENGNKQGFENLFYIDDGRVQGVEDFNRNYHYDEYTVVVLVHHPFNWLFELERPSPFDGSGLSSINKVLLKADVLLTGHEHLTKENKIKVENDIVHIEAGKLMNIRKGYMANRFSVLDLEIGIDCNIPKISETKYFNNSFSDWSSEESFNESIELVKWTKKRFYPVFDLYKSFEISVEKLLKYLNCFVFQESNCKSLKQCETDLSNFFVYEVEFEASSSNSKNYLFLIKPSNSIDFNENKLFNYLKNILSGDAYCILMFYDTCISKDEFSNYNINGEGCDRTQLLECYGQISRNIDTRINFIRNNFYTKFIDKKQLQNFMNVKFISHTIPHWRIKDIKINT